MSWSMGAGTRTARLLASTPNTTTTGARVMDAYRDRDDRGVAPYRAAVNGKLIRNKDGSVRKFRTLAAACRYLSNSAV